MSMRVFIFERADLNRSAFSLARISAQDLQSESNPTKA
jgi:hypothetical protein